MKKSMVKEKIKSIFRKKLKTYIVYFSEGHTKKRYQPVYCIEAKNTGEAYNKARDLLESQFQVNGSPYFFIRKI